MFLLTAMKKQSTLGMNFKPGSVQCVTLSHDLLTMYVNIT